MNTTASHRNGRRGGRLAAWLMAAGTLLASTSAVAWHGPPEWAPAYGYRAKHAYHHHDRHVVHKHYHYYHHEPYYHKPRRVYREVHVHRHVVPAPRTAPVYGGYQSGSAAGLVGAAAGGFLGAQVGDGRGQLAATAAGTLMGYFLGRQVGRHHGSSGHYYSDY